MSELANARYKATLIRSHMRQGKTYPAIQALYDTIVTMLKTPLMKPEREEFEKLIGDGTYHIMADQALRTSAGVSLKYVPGQERDLMDSLRMLMEALQDGMTEEAEAALRLALERRQAKIQQGQDSLNASDYTEARRLFRSVASEQRDDGLLMLDIGERFLKALQYDDAVEYFTEALALTPGALQLYNQLAMALRKLGRYAEAERTYMLAAKNDTRDPHLFFNLGRLYVDWKRWENAIKAAKRALELDPNFAEAKKLIAYAEKKLPKP